MILLALHPALGRWTQDTRAVATFFGAVGDMKYPIVTAFRADADLVYRRESVRAIGSAVLVGRSVDSLAVEAIASVVCDMSYLIRPFLRENRISRPYDSAASQFWFQEATSMYLEAIATLELLADNGVDRAADLLERYEKIGLTR